MKTNRSVVQTNDFPVLSGEGVFICDVDRLAWSHGEVPSPTARSVWRVGTVCFGGRAVLRRGVRGSATARPETAARSMVLARLAAAFLVVGLVGTGTSAGAATKTTKRSVKSKTTVKRKPVVRPTTTLKPALTATKLTSVPSSTPKLSAEAQSVLAGYEAYLMVFASAAHDPENAEAILPKGVTGDALARLIDIARYDLSQGQYWDGKRTDIVSRPRVQSIGESRATIRDCQSVGGVLRKRATNEIVGGTTDPDIDDLVVDLVKLDGHWVVTRTDRTNAVEGKGTCAAASSP